MKRFWRIVIAFIVIWMFAVAGLVVAVYTFGQSTDPEPADVIIVLGAGIRRDGRPGDALYRRSIRGAEAWQAGYADYIICTGGKSEDRPRSEASACRDVLISRGIPANAIILEEKARSTEENAIFSREIMQTRGWKDAILITDSYHMLRANWIFNDYAIMHYPYPVPNEWIRARIYAWSLGREIVALHWQAFKQLFNLPVTYVSFG